MPAQPSHRIPLLIVLFTLLYAAVHLTYEHFSGGVQSHHLLNRADLPAISNWFGLVTLPALGGLLGLRVHRGLKTVGQLRIPRFLWVGLIGALFYGAALAVFFELGVPSVSSGLFFGLFLIGIILPIYRVEFVLGFVVGMTFTFGAVLPTLIAAVIAIFSFLSRLILRAIISAWRSVFRPSGVA